MVLRLWAVIEAPVLVAGVLVLHIAELGPAASVPAEIQTNLFEL